MDSIVELVKRNEQLLLENAEALNDEEVEQEDIDEYLKIQGATKEELSAFENQFQIRLPEDFKTVYSYKNGSGYMSLIWPQEGFYRGYRLLSLKEIIKLKSLFQNKNGELKNAIHNKRQFLMAMIPFIRGYAHICLDPEDYYGLLSGIMHGYGTGSLDVVPIYNKLFGEVFDGQEIIGVTDILGIDSSNLDILDKTYSVSYTHLTLPTKLEV